MPRGVVMSDHARGSGGSVQRYFRRGRDGRGRKRRFMPADAARAGASKLPAMPEDEAVEIAKKILGMTLVTHQTGPEGRVVQRLLIEETLPIEQGTLSRPRARSRGWKNRVMASAAGGMEIEEVAAKDPERPF